MIGYFDADWTGSTEDRKNTSSYCFFFSKNSAALSWKSRKHPTNALSNCEAEYFAISSTIQEATFLTQVINEIVDIKTMRNVNLYADNQGAIALTKGPIENSKYIDTKYHFIKLEVGKGTVLLQYISTENNTADIFTKPMTRNRLQMSAGLIGH